MEVQQVSEYIKLLEETAHLVLLEIIEAMNLPNPKMLLQLIKLQLKNNPQKLLINIILQALALEDMETTNHQNLNMEKQEYKNLNMIMFGLEIVKWLVQRDSLTILKKLTHQ